MSDIQEGFGDFDEDDVYDDGLDLIPDEADWSKIEQLQQRYDEIRVIPDQAGRKIAAKLLIQELNGESRGTVLVT